MPGLVLTGRTGTNAIISTRIAGTDGVSLEIEKWANVIERNDGECYYIAGELDRPDIIIPENALTIPMAIPLGVALDCINSLSRPPGI